jgi:hypothetical protein
MIPSSITTERPLRRRRASITCSGSWTGEREMRYWIERENLHLPCRTTGEGSSVASGDRAGHH